MPSHTYRLELHVTDQGTPFYPTVDTIERPSSDNAGYDLKVVIDQASSNVAVLVPLGLKARMIRYTDMGDGIHIGEDCHFSLEPRSSIYKSGFMMANGRGIIDKTYRGELMAPLISVGGSTKSIEAGNRLFQIIAPDMGHISEVVYVSSLPTTVRGVGGFGSTGLK
jgi:deoxyuridine 5'-triphosphate nucleotidohydrolase